MLLLVFFTGFLFTALVLPRLAYIASRIGLMDIPNKRKVHLNPKPLVGGIGITMGFCFSALMFIPLSNLRGFFLAIILLVVVGFLDDFSDLGHRFKFLAQVVAAMLMMKYSKIVLYSFGDLLALGDLRLGVLSGVMTVIGVVGVINALNMIDGLDGLSGSVSIAAFSVFALLAYLDKQPILLSINIAFLGVITAFIIYNHYPAKLFMGDAGSMVLGFALAFMSIAITQHEGSTVPPVAPLLILTVPIVDTLVLMILRTHRGKSPFHPDRFHLHHILTRIGFSVNKTVLIITSMTLFFSLLAVLTTLAGISAYYMFFIFLVYFSVCMYCGIHMKSLYRRALYLKRKGHLPAHLAVFHK